MRPVANIPNSVTVHNLRAERVDFASLGAVPANGTKTFDLTKLSGASMLAHNSPKSRLWHAIAHAHLKGTVEVTATTPSVTISSGVDGLGKGVISAQQNVLRPGMPDYRTDAAGPMITGLTMGAANAYVDIAISKGVYKNDAGLLPLLAAGLTLTFTQGDGDATACVIAGIKKNDAVTLGAATALAGGETVVRAFLTVTGTPDGNETINLKFAANAAKDSLGHVAPSAQSMTTNLLA